MERENHPRRNGTRSIHGGPARGFRRRTDDRGFPPVPSRITGASSAQSPPQYGNEATWGYWETAYSATARRRRPRTTATLPPDLRDILIRRGHPARTKKRGFHGSLSFLCRNQNNQQFLLQWNSSSIQYSRGMAFFMFSMRAFSFSESIAWRRI